MSRASYLFVALTAAFMATAPGCSSLHCGRDACSSCDTCPPADACGTCGHCGGCGSGWGFGDSMAGWRTSLCGCFHRRSNAIPDTLPLGSTVRAHYQVMQTNAEAADFIIHRRDFVGETAELTPEGRDHILEIAARMPSAPFPVVVERSMNNSNPEVDMLRRNLVAQVLTDLGNPDANSRTVVSMPYGRGYTGREAERTWYRHTLNGGVGSNNGTNGFNGVGGIGLGGF